ncbi:hypothetical protein CHS0354_011479 [Potamilus streckersoni]|uniref:Alpha-ketoglutarate-dependent dioxygenase alkB homolog 3 n=1 Tax=Potamilus streckersoni TaxID=2493646 RepID=A0AAE0SL18_9BIVA|nr:hypothetical protein CHS0354_011479 [Potamilus streckersoni]
MSSDKKRRSRVQGGWAPPTNIRSDRDKPKPEKLPNWFGKNVDQPVEKKFVYEDNTQELREKPPERVLSKPGVYDLSLGPSGLSRIRFFPNFIEPDEAEWMFTEMHNELQWQQRSDVKNGKSYLQPRLTAWYGDLPYSYSGVTHMPNKEWPDVLRIIKERLEEVTGNQFNSLLANLYRDGHNHVNWHSDDEKSLGPEPTIASLSFGDTRNFEMRKKPPPGITDKKEENGDYTFMEHVRIPLSSGSLLIMEGCTQADWQHQIPKEYHDRSARINLTFRVIYPE